MGTLYAMASHAAQVAPTWLGDPVWVGLAVGLVIGVILIFVQWRSPSSLERIGTWISKPRARKQPKRSTADWSWQGTALKLFYVTATLAFLTLLGFSIQPTATGHFSSAIVFTDLAGAGTLLSGVAASLVFIFGYWNRQKQSSQQSTATVEVINQVLEEIGRPPTAEEIKAIAELARALNNDRGDKKGEGSLEIESGPTRGG